MQKGISASGFVGDYWRVSVSGDLSKIPMRDKIAAKRTQKKRHLVHGITISRLNWRLLRIRDRRRSPFSARRFHRHSQHLPGLRAIHEALQKASGPFHLRPAHADRTDKRGRGQLRADGALCIDGRPLALRPSSPFQIASAQTLARRQWPDDDLIVIDEAHVQMSVWVNKIKSCTAHVIGLSATPFSDGLGSFSKSRLRVEHAAHRVRRWPMVSIHTSEYARRGDPEAANGRICGGRARHAIIGDVVSRWEEVRRRKTIAFGATIAHREKSAKPTRGVMATSFSPAKLAGRAAWGIKTGFHLRVLLSVSALAKGL